MSSLEEFEFSLITTDDTLFSPPVDRSKSAAPPDYLDVFLKENNLLDPNNTYLPPFERAELDRFLDAPNAFEQAALSSTEHTTHHECETTEHTGNDLTMIETSDTLSYSNPIDNRQSTATVEFLRLLTPPHPYQRARYEKELDDDLRYISTPNENSIELEMPDLRSRLAENVSVVMRVSRTTTTYGPDGIIFGHPYPLYTTNAQAVSHHGSILFPVTNKQMEDQLIKIEDLINGRLLQRELKEITRWPIYTPNQLDCNGYHSVDLSKAKDIIRNYNLRYFILRFQVFLVDADQIAHPTDLLCQTQPIYEYEYQELENLPAPFARKRNSRNKRLEKESIATKQNRPNRTPRRTKANRLKGLIRTTNTEF